MQLDMLHRNLRPELQKLVRRAGFRDIDELQEMAPEAEMTLKMERLFQPPPLPDITMLQEVAYEAKAKKPVMPKLSGVETGEHDGFASQEMSPDESILAAISRLEAGLNEIRNQQNYRQSGNNPKIKGDYRQRVSD